MILPIVLLVAVAAGDDGAESAPAETVVRLHARAVVRGTELRLSDFADVSGPRAAEASALSMGFAPSPGRERIVAAESVAQRMAALGFERRAFKVVGKLSTVRVATQLIPAAELTRRVMDLTTPQLRPGTTIDVRAPLSDWILPEPRDAVAPTEFELASDVLAVRGDGSVDVRAVCKGEVLGLQSVAVRVVQRAEVLVAVSTLQRGDAADPSRFEKKLVDVTHVTGEPITDASSLTGRILARSLAKDAVLTSADLAAAPLYRRGDQTRLVIQRGSLRIEALVRVDADASAGSTVPVTCIEFGKSLVARVRDDGTLTLNTETSR